MSTKLEAGRLLLCIAHAIARFLVRLARALARVRADD
jgi:hypothetical protein